MEDDQNFFSILLLICVYIAQNNALSKSGGISSQATDKWQILSGDVTHFTSTAV